MSLLLPVALIQAGVWSAISFLETMVIEKINLEMSVFLHMKTEDHSFIKYIVGPRYPWVIHSMGDPTLMDSEIYV